MKPLHRRFLAFFLPISGALLALALLLYRQHAVKKIRVAESEGRYAVALESQLIEEEYRAAASDLLYLSGQGVLQDFLARPGAATREALAREYLLFASRKGLYDRVRFVDAAGREAVRVDASGVPRIAPESRRGASDLSFFHEALALQKGRAYVSSFDLDGESGGVVRPFQPTLRFATPVFDARGLRRGLLVLDYSGARLLRLFNENAANSPGGLMLLNGDGLWLHGAGREDEEAIKLDRDRRFGEDYPDAWREMLGGAKERLSTREGLFAFKSFDPAEAGLETGGRATSALRIVYVMPAPRLSLQSHKVRKTLLALCAFIEAVLAVLIGFLCRAHAAKALHQRQLEGSEARLRALSNGLIETQELERKSLSRDLHDDLGQLLTAVCLELERALRPEGRADRLDVVRRALEGTRVALDRMRDISSRLRPRVLDEIGLKEAVRSLLDEYHKKTGIDVREELRFQNSDVPGDAGVNVYRILQEALTNAAKHARTKNVLVSIGLSGGALALSVKDWGVGFAERPSSPGALGLLSMRERAELSGGTFRVVSQPGHGTDIRVTIPLPVPQAARTAS